MNAIPKRENPRKDCDARYIEEPFCEIPSEGRLLVKMQYPLLGMQHSESRCVARKTVVEKLREASEYLPPGLSLQVWDAWRPFALQQELYEVYRDLIIEMFDLEERSEAEQKKKIAEFVAAPEKSEQYPPVHTTGGAVDVTLVDAQGKELDMGTEFDAFLPETATDYFEEYQFPKIQKNRRMLYDAMTRAGFVNLPSEWWHYDYGDHIWGHYTGKAAMYRGCDAWEDISLVSR